jgi:hypothetical protein
MKSGNVWDDFTWEVAIDGYKLEKTSDGLTLKGRTDLRTAPTRVYRPFDRAHSSLFRDFSALRGAGDYLAFANRYGLLGVPVLTTYHGGLELHTYVDFSGMQPSEVAKTLMEGADVGEPVGADSVGEWSWERQSDQMRDFVRCADDAVQRSPHMGIEVVRLASRALSQTAAPYMTSSVSDETVRARKGKPLATFDLHIRPRSLLGVMWLQAATWLTKRKVFKLCEACKRPIEISRGTSSGARTDARFCSDACKSRDYRNRRRDAIARHAEVISARQIAKRLRTTAKQVRAWLKDK